nr:hypothetical protein [Lentzea atacamensis]
MACWIRALGCWRGQVMCRLTADRGDFFDVLLGEAQMLAEEPAGDRSGGGAAAEP